MLFDIIHTTACSGLYDHVTRVHYKISILGLWSQVVLLYNQSMQKSPCHTSALLTDQKLVYRKRLMDLDSFELCLQHFCSQLGKCSANVEGFTGVFKTMRTGSLQPCRGRHSFVPNAKNGLPTPPSSWGHLVLLLSCEKHCMPVKLMLLSHPWCLILFHRKLGHLHRLPSWSTSHGLAVHHM